MDNNNLNEDFLFSDLEADESKAEENKGEEINLTEELNDSVEQETVSYENESITEEKPDKTNIGLISFCLLIGAFAISGLGGVLSSMGFDLAMYGALEAIQGLMVFASFILMIITRVKYPKDGFGKAVMWLFIVGLIFLAVIIITLIVFCSSCANELHGF